MGFLEQYTLKYPDGQVRNGTGCLLFDTFMKTYLFVIPSAFRVNAILRTDIYRTLTKQGNARIVIVSPFAKEEKFKKEFAEAIHVPSVKLSLPLVRRISRMRDIILGINHPFFAKARAIERSITEHKVILKPTTKEITFAWLRAPLRPLRGILAFCFDRLEERVFRISAYDAACRSYAPNAVITGTVTEPEDAVWLAYARRFGASAHVVDMPWSYIENRVYAPPRPAHLYAWTDAVRDEIKKYYNFPDRLIHVVGSQRYDWYAHGFPTYTREEFLQKIGADPAKKLITYFVGSSYLNPHEHDVAALILEAIKKGELPSDTQLVVRIGWKQKVEEEFKRLLEEYDNFIIQEADELPDQTYPSHLVYFSDVSMSSYSSLALDAAVLDRPSIFTGFAGSRFTHPDDASIARIYDYEFVKKALATEGVRVAYDATTFLSLIAGYIADPLKDSENRHAMTKTFFGTIDGKAGERIAKSIIAFSK